MYGVLIVDDEPWVREGITNLIDWESHNMEILASLEDGVEALRFIKEKARTPDIVLTDIRMPGKSGLELLEEMLDVVPGVRGVILSGYRDFEYARKAIHCGVFEYLVKPVGRRALLDTMVRLITQLDEEAKHGAAGAGTQGSGAAPAASQRSEATHQTTDSSPTGTEGGGLSLLIRRTVKSIDNHITEDIGLTDVAAELSVNASYLSALFSESMEETFKQYVTRRKIEKAKEIWHRDPSLRVYELCSRVGYQDVDYFSRLFKQIEGVTPREYKNHPRGR
jgi:YesN/AraC family two-component response regulator